MENNPYESPVTVESSSPQSQLPTSDSNIPKIFGIIHIVYAVLGGVAGLVAFVGALWVKNSKFFEELGAGDAEVKEQMQTVQDQVESTFQLTMIDSATKMVLAVILLVAGIQLLRRKKIGATLSKVWAVLRIVIVIPMTYFSTMASMAAQERLMETGNGEIATAGFNMPALTIVGSIVGVLFISAYPIVTLIFMSKKFLKGSLK